MLSVTWWSCFLYKLRLSPYPEKLIGRCWLIVLVCNLKDVHRLKNKITPERIEEDDNFFFRPDFPSVITIPAHVLCSNRSDPRTQFPPIYDPYSTFRQKRDDYCSKLIDESRCGNPSSTLSSSVEENEKDGNQHKNLQLYSFFPISYIYIGYYAVYILVFELAIN